MQVYAETCWKMNHLKACEGCGQRKKRIQKHIPTGLSLRHFTRFVYDPWRAFDSSMR